MQGASTLQDLSNYETAKFGPYEWLVLDRSEEGMLLITKEGIAVRPYHEEFERVTWEKCSLRSWLNGEFLNGFTDEERAMILKTRVKNHGNPSYETPGGNNTKDQVFLLSIEEANQYFKTDENRICIPEETIKEDVYIELGACWWWLRDTGGSKYAACVAYDGGNSRLNCVDRSDLAVRPAMWVDLERTSPSSAKLLKKLKKVFSPRHRKLA